MKEAVICIHGIYPINCRFCKPWDDRSNLEIEIQTLKAQLKVAVEGLEFYANGRWVKQEIITEDGLKGHTYRPLFSLRNDHGTKAREALTKITEMENK